MSFARTTLAAASLLLFAGCPGPSIEPTWSSIEDEIVTPSCSSSSCHGGAAPVRGLDLNPGRGWADMVDVEAETAGWTLIVPGSPDESLFYRVLIGEVGDIRQMPPAFALDEGMTEAVRVWIEEGAEFN